MTVKGGPRDDIPLQLCYHMTRRMQISFHRYHDWQSDGEVIHSGPAEVATTAAPAAKSFPTHHVN